jgi:O-antigen/teichoic acid export membrane protein
MRQILHKLKDKKITTKLIKGGIGNSLIQAFGQFFSLLLSILLARFLGVEKYGIYAYAIAIMNILSIAAEAGVPVLLMRETSINFNQQKFNLLFGSILRAYQFVGLVSISISIVGLAIIWKLNQTYSDHQLYTLYLIMVFLPVAALMKTTSHALAGVDSLLSGQFLDLIARPATTALLFLTFFLLIPSTQQPGYAIIFQIISAILALTISIKILTKKIPKINQNKNQPKLNITWIKSTIPFALLGGVSIIAGQTDIVMLGYFSSPENVGIYRVSVQGATLILFSMRAITMVAGPYFSILHAKKDLKQLQQVVKTTSRICFFISALTLIILFAFGEEIITTVFGQNFKNSYTTLIILSTGQTINSFFGPSGTLTTMTGNERVSVITVLAVAIANIILNSILIPQYGNVGAAIATAVSTAPCSIILCLYVKSKMSISTLPL